MKKVWTIEYGRGYHTNMDTYERLLMNDMKHNAVIVAALVYHTAMRNNLLTRKPLPGAAKRKVIYLLVPLPCHSPVRPLTQLKKQTIEYIFSVRQIS